MSDIRASAAAQAACDASGERFAPLRASVESIVGLDSADGAENRSASYHALANDLIQWLHDHVSEDGLWLDDPWRTFALAPALDRVRSILRRCAWSDALEERYQAILAMTMQTAVADGWLMSDALGPDGETIERMCRFVGRPRWRQWWNVPRWLWGAKRPLHRVAAKRFGFESDAAGIAVLRRDWSAPGAVLAVDFRGPRVRIEFRVDGQTLLNGVWDSTLHVDDQALAIEGPWSATCWHGDEDGEFLELQARPNPGLLIERQMFLSRQTRSLWLAEVVKSERPVEGSWRWRLPSMAPARIERERGRSALRIKALGGFARFLPLVDPADGEKAATNGAAVVAAEASGLSIRAPVSGDRGLLPLVVTWERGKRPSRLPVWRRLTVTNDRRCVGCDEASAFLVPIEDATAVYFRALRRRARYAFIGFQTFAETSLLSLDHSGAFEQWTQIEG